MSRLNKDTQGSQKTRTGRVVGSKMDKTVVVQVERTYQHPLIKKHIRSHKKYYAHDVENTCKVGDTVRIVECRPLSKMKRWRLEQVIVRAK